MGKERHIVGVNGKKDYCPSCTKINVTPDVYKLKKDKSKYFSNWGDEYPFICKKCELSVMILESYEEDITDEQKREI
jgi:hypothetical protein